MRMKWLVRLDVGAFVLSVAAGSTAAVAGWRHWSGLALFAGCVAVIAPIVNRVIAGRQQKALLELLGPRRLSAEQRRRLISSLKAGPTFSVWVAHNRREAEPSQLHNQIYQALAEAGLQAKWFGGMNNATVGIEISGPPSPDKTRLMDAFTAAAIPFLPIEFSDPSGEHWGLAIWIGSNPPPPPSLT